MLFAIFVKLIKSNLKSFALIISLYEPQKEWICKGCLSRAGLSSKRWKDIDSVVFYYQIYEHCHFSLCMELLVAIHWHRAFEVQYIGRLTSTVC